MAMVVTERKMDGLLGTTKVVLLPFCCTKRQLLVENSSLYVAQLGQRC